MIRFEKSAGAVVYYIKNRKEPEFLLLKYPNYWGFPKGLIEENENENETAVREIDEETGLKVRLIPGFQENQEWFYRLNNKTIKKKAVFFLAKVTEEESKKVKISSEHEAFSWLSYAEALKKIKIKANKELLKKAYDFIEEINKQKKLF